MGSGSKGGNSEVTVGYKYLLGVQLIGCHGPVDSVNRIVIGERLAWQGKVTESGTIYVDKPELFGGNDREGGVQGYVDVMMGEATQGRNSYLATHQGANCPAYRGLLSILFRSFMWSSGNPYFKSPWVEVTRILKGWENDTPWNPDYAIVNEQGDMNPAHIIYQCLTDSRWGMGYTAADMGDSFATVATTLRNEAFGLSLRWDQQSSIEDFVKMILSHINGTLALDMRTGKFELRLIRYDYNMDDLLVLDESNVVEVRSFQRATFGEFANEVVVTYTDRDENDKPVTVQNLASIAAQGAVVSTAKSYPGIRDDRLAARVALRDLATLSTPLAQITVVTNRVLWEKEIGDVVKLVWPSRGIDGVAFRVITINKGNHAEGTIEAQLVEDVFGLPEANYTSAPQSAWVETVVPPVAADAAVTVEAPYWEVIRRVSMADQAYLQPGYGFGTLLAGRGSVQTMLGFTLSASADNLSWSDVSSGNFSPVGVLVSNISATEETVVLTGAYDLDSAVLEGDGGYAYVDQECMAVVDVNPTTGVVVVRRGVLDTPPIPHAAGAKMFFVTPAAAYDSTERVSGETVHYKPRPKTGIGTLTLDDAETETLVLSNRASRPYPPGNFKVDGEPYPLYITGPNFVVTWSHRDRAAQTVDFVDYKTGNIGPEPGTTYRLRVYSGATLKRTYDLAGSATSWSYPTAHSVEDGDQAVIRITLHSVRDGLESWRGIDHSFQRNIVGGGTVIGSPPATPGLSAINDKFSIKLSWVFGDSRTNIQYAELRVSDTPDINHSTVLQYVAYPDQHFEHVLGTVSTFRWYWVRVADTDGLLSGWSNLASGRTLGVTLDAILGEINTALSDPATSDTLELRADRFTIVSPDGTKTPFALVETAPGVWKAKLDSDVVIGGNVDIANLNTGSLREDVMLRLGGGVIELDGAGEIRVFKDTSSTADFVRLSSGEIRFLRYINGAYQTYNYLSRIESGVATSGDTVTIPGFWKAMPRVMVSPANLAIYKAAYASQDQAINCQAVNLRETFTGSGVWQFDAIAMLTFASGGGQTPVNLSSGDLTATTTWTSAAVTTPPNCTHVTPTVRLKSFRWLGTGATFQRRTVSWRVRYSGDGVGGAWRVTDIGATVDNVNDSYTFTFPAAGTHTYWLEFSAADVSGSFVGSDATYDASIETKTSTTQWSVPMSSPYIAKGGVTMPSYSPPTGWVIGNVTWTYTGKYRTVYEEGALVFPDYPRIMNSGVSYQDTFVTSGRTEFGVYNASYPLYYTYVIGEHGGGATGVAITTATAQIEIRRYSGYTASGQNRFDFVSYSSNLSANQALAVGTMNWQATGE